MKYLFIAFIALTLISCGTKTTKHSNSAKKNDKLDTAKSVIQIASPDKHLISLLKSKQIISSNYPDTLIKLLDNTNINEKINFIGIQFQYDTSLQNLYESELVYNAMILHSNEKLIHYHVIDAVYEEDFKFLYESEQYIIYEFYSSPVGYTIYFILDTKSMYLYKTEAIEEGFAIDTSNINFNNKTLLTSFNKKNKTYSLIKIW